ncbi:hypothetical protein DFR58_11013 [Anaerobacterium chartisolvens]|uniref:Uncharacterized protein n=2 Tax=Anaerobacterium chartisolvens TaxID=1297424 RepID=A0A369B4P4_9FIRM|nr:hypothetical protein DFR58_11013 [Anaerobacterium chartisolvens]
MLAILFKTEDMTAVKADKNNRLEFGFLSSKTEITNFAQKLTSTTCVVVKESVRSSTARAGKGLGDRVFTTGFNKFKFLTMR